MPHSPLLTALSTPARGGLDGSLAAPLGRLLLSGHPVEVSALAAAVGTSAEDVRRRLSAMPETEYDARGRIVGYVLTQVETPHRFRVCDTQLYTWCPLDTVIVPRLVGCTAHVEGVCALTGERIGFVSTPDGLHGLTHADAAITLPEPDDVTHLRSAFCQHVRFVASTAAARTQLSDDHRLHVMPLRQAHALGVALADRLRASQRDFAKAV